VIHEIWSPTRPTFKRLKFKPGLNIVSVRRTATASSTGKRNAAGKSSLIDVIHFLLGGNRESGSPLSAPELQSDAFTMLCDVAGNKVAITRGLADARSIYVMGDFKNWPRQPDIAKDGTVSLSNDDWCDLLGQVMLGLPAASTAESGGYLTFRSTFPYFARRQRAGGYADWRRFFFQQRPVQWQVSLAFLFGLDREGPLALHRIKEADRQKANLEKLLKTELASVAVPSTAKLRASARKLERQLAKLETQLSGFRVIDYYDDLVDEANTLQQEIDALTNSNVLDDELARDIAAALESEHAPDLPDLQLLYKDAGIVLPDKALKRYAEVEKFHIAVVENRREHLSSELDDTKRRTAIRRAELAQKSERRNAILQTLNTGGALLQYRKLDNQSIASRSELETVKRQLELAENIDAMKTDLKVQRAQAERRIKQDLKERAKQVEDAAVVFEEISQKLYDQPAVLEIVADKDGLDFEIDAPEIASEGIRQVQIFTFDLTLATLCARKGRWPGTLIHDSHIFDGVDGRQIALALSSAAERVAALGGQYIVTMNSDDLEKAEREGQVSFKKYIVEPELDDSPTGCLFGFRFATGDDDDEGSVASSQP
jgi:uncharacterized protein YydD (DUF2326 family)